MCSASSATAWAIAVLASIAAATPPTSATLARSDATCSIDELPGLSAQLRRVRGETEENAVELRDRRFTGSVGLPSLRRLSCKSTVRQRDHMAWSMGLAGYSAREIADVLEGHLTRADLDEALRRSMAGQPRIVVAAFLDSRWREPETPDAEDPAPMTLGDDRLRGGKLEREIAAFSRRASRRA